MAIMMPGFLHYENAATQFRRCADALTGLSPPRVYMAETRWRSMAIMMPGFLH
jgi:hypothetical protein